jgi:glycosyltransferase involved in cell wall biosynthesis
MSAAPRVSVVIPAYESARRIAQTLDSVRAQTFSDYEILVVNDGSPDTAELERVLAPYRDHIHYLKQDNRGAGAARNAGLRAARGEFAAFLDADDLWLPTYLERQVAFLDARHCDLACADAELFGDAPEGGRSFMESFMPDAPAAGEASFLELLGARRCLITSGVVVRRDLALAEGGFDEALRNSQDYDLWLRLALHKARLGFHREVLLRYRVSAVGLTGDALNAERRDLLVFDKIERTYSFAPGERDAALAVIRARRASLQFEIGKLQLLAGDFPDARASFAESRRQGGGWKTGLALWLTRAAPAAARSLYSYQLERKRR